jgi:hypothetical protein
VILTAISPEAEQGNWEINRLADVLDLRSTKGLEKAILRRKPVLFQRPRLKFHMKAGPDFD